MPDIVVVFSQKEKEYLGSQCLARIATASPPSPSLSSSSEGFIQPDVVPQKFKATAYEWK